jgi:uncharacterized DUF497 family protein
MQKLRSVVFEFDIPKSQQNLLKHGIDFSKATCLWDGWTVEIPARSEDEPRFAVIGKIQGVCWVAFCTKRGERVRIISVRRAREREKSVYEETRKTKDLGRAP